MQRQQAGASSAGVQPIHVLRNHAAHGAQLLQLGERIVGAVRFGTAHAAPTHVGARPVALAGYVIVTEFLVGHGAVVVQGAARSAVVRDAGFGAHSSAGEHENLTGLEQLGNTRGGVFFVVRGGVLRDNALNRADCGTVHGGDFFALLTGGCEVLVVIPAIHSSPQCSVY